MDLDLEARRALELDELLAWVATFASTAPGARRVAARGPVADAAALGDELARLEEAGRFLERAGRFVSRGLPDPDPAARLLGVAGASLDAKGVRELALVLREAGELGQRLAGPHVADCPGLRAAAADLADFGRECGAVLRGVDPEGLILDEASPELARIRGALAAAGERLRRILVERLRDPHSGASIRDEFVTERNGRFVIPWRADAPRAPQGIVHAASSSGATLFVEPLSTVELNNERVRLADAEREECARLLAAWTESFRTRESEVRRSLERLADLDDVQARALYGRAVHGTVPRVAAGGPLALERARHPLLLRRLAQAGAEPVPFDLALDPADQVLLVSGPNAGGKTVVLKTIGLAVLAAQAGLPVPAAAATIPLYLQVRADIGDRQSIEADLSTYSAHLQAVAGFLATRARPALFLFDEIGTGTEPGEGAALARAVLERLRGGGTTVVATTHLGALKSWGMGAESVTSAAMEFDEHSLRATYRLSTGAAGVSAGLQIAERLGLDPAVVERARELLDPRAREAEGYLRALREARNAAEARRDELERRQIEVAERLARAEEEFGQRERTRREETRLALARALEELRREAGRTLGAITDEAQRARAQRRWRKAEPELATSAAARAQPALGPAEPAVPEPVERPWGLGSAVRVLSLGREGQVVALDGERVRVRLGGLVTTVARADVRGAGPGGAVPATPAVTRPAPGPAATTPDTRELMLVGQRVEAALEALDRFLDTAVVAGADEVRIVHGHGTGRLRAAVRRFLGEHPQVAWSRPGERHEGGDGATVAGLKA